MVWHRFGSPGSVETCVAGVSLCADPGGSSFLSSWNLTCS
ncbi:hypothetical protein AZ78_1047 [Lysobacter capsici AZ78]|uniref:Uncharacterized protein n=1 Tax=Lysobacter capsici AZ78 TaxID=1444315 RepID=A0A120AFS7_9GAMM|nr:hypothetical protein AZ78_1047 [Lysobacter capsici AZ78]